MKLGSLEIDVIRSKRRKTLCINIERNGSVNVLAPENCDEQEIFRLVSAKEYDIFKQIETLKGLNKEAIIRQFVDGQSFLYLGKNYNLSIKANEKAPLQLKDGKFILSLSALTKAEEYFIKFYKKQGKTLIAERIERFSKYLTIKPKAFRILELRTRWASCSPSGNLNFNWKCIMAPPSVLDYLVVHEMAHLSHPKHSRSFWDAVFAIMPDYKEKEDWLKRNGAKLTL